VLAGEVHGNDTASLYDVASLYGRRGDILGVYRKDRLSPFVEYVPSFGGTLDERRRFATPKPGTQSGVLEVEGVHLAVTICFEALFPDMFRARAGAGAHIFVNLSNDRAFGNTAERYPHLYMSLARAVEQRRPCGAGHRRSPARTWKGGAGNTGEGS
jgi:apolipoprotein N-acyltransferase